MPCLLWMTSTLVQAAQYSVLWFGFSFLEGQFPIFHDDCWFLVFWSVVKYSVP